MRRSFTRLAAALSMLSPASALAMDEPPGPVGPSDQIGDEKPVADAETNTAAQSEIVVIGNRIPDDEVRDYIGEILFPERVGAVKFYARQGAPLCPTVMGLAPASKQFVIERMRKVAKSAGIDVSEEEDCNFNLVIALVDDGPATIKRWRREYNRQTFGWMPPHARNTVMWSDGPAYAWHIVDRGGSRLSNASGSSSLLAGAGSLDGALANPVLANPSNPHMQIGVPEVIYTGFVLVERDALDGVSATQLADYGLMRGMMQIQLKQDTSKQADSILNLFDDGVKPQEHHPSLTRVDLALLVSLYSARGNVSAGRQRGDMLEPFKRVLAHGEAGVDQQPKRKRSR
ncbi:MAG: hypothetical protein AAF291_10020 [Pseudomonadota bacterium]